MSTKSSIAYSESIHLWFDVIDEHVYLRFAGPRRPGNVGWEEITICMDRLHESEFETMCRDYIRWVDEAATWRPKR